MMPPVAILAGGLATRLYPVTKKIPKALIDINGTPFIFRQLELLQREGVREVVLCVGYLGEMIEEVLGNGGSIGISIQYSYDGDTLLGTGGAIKKALPLLGKRFGVLYGDSYLDTPYRPIYETFEAGGRKGLMTVYENKGKWDTSNIIFRNGMIEKYSKSELTPDMHHIDYGLSFFKQEAFELYPEGDVLDLTTVFRDLIEEDELMGYDVPDRFFEIGKEEGLEELRSYLRDT
jgi:NDP-sugar pyrophosphorylase family protein